MLPIKQTFCHAHKILSSIVPLSERHVNTAWLTPSAWAPSVVPFLCETRSLCSDPLQPVPACLAELTTQFFQNDSASSPRWSGFHPGAQCSLSCFQTTSLYSMSCRQAGRGPGFKIQLWLLPLTEGRIGHIFILPKPVFSYSKMEVIELFPRTVGRISTTVSNPVSTTRVCSSLCPT